VNSEKNRPAVAGCGGLEAPTRENKYTEYRFDESLGHLASNASRAILKRINRELCREGLPITSEQLSVLVHIWNWNGQPQRVHAELLCKDKTTMARIFSGLESLGLVERETGPKDAREKIVYLSEEGKSVMAQVTQQVMGILKIAQKGIDEGDLVVCRKVLRRFQQNLV
jgi:DNA-binding MarR family transcriptional regulator